MKIRKLIIMILAVAILLSSSDYTDITFAGTADKKDKTIVGAPTQKTWTFEANNSGTYKIVFTYSRSWEKDTSDSKTVEYTVNVKDEKSTDASVVALVTEKENTVNKNQKFSITLEENASTGYSWSYDIKDNGITFINTEKEPLVGAPVQKVWTFGANKSGTYKIVFTYVGPGDKDASNSKTVVYKIKVAKKNGSKSDAVGLTEGKVNKVNKNQKFFVSLEENPSTGYSWSYKASTKKMKLYNEETVEAVGAPTQKLWTFKANKSGTYKIVYTYSRPWEKDTSDSKKVEYTVKVTDENTSDSSSIALIEGKENSIKIGQKFFVSLEENTSTGYSWDYSIIGNIITITK